MPQTPEFDLAAAHRYFAADCFNKAWELMEKTDRTPAEDDEMLRLSLASHYHWTQRPDYDDTAASVAYWQTSRIYALLDGLQEFEGFAVELSQQLRVFLQVQPDRRFPCSWRRGGFGCRGDAGGTALAAWPDLTLSVVVMPEGREVLNTETVRKELDGVSVAPKHVVDAVLHPHVPAQNLHHVPLDPARDVIKN